MLLAAACQSPASAVRADVTTDQHSAARPREVAVRHLDLDLDLDFAARTVSGTAVLHLRRSDPNAPLVLDTDGLEIAEVRGGDGTSRAFELAPPGAFGAALTIALAGNDDTVTVRYRTSPSAAALQWLAPEQTDSERGPFLYTQGQAILTRSWIPLQDTPAVRMTYGARVRAPARTTVVMAARALPREADGAWRFRMEQPIPSYLIALACGTLAFEPLGSRCGVWAEPTVVAKAAAEFADVPEMLRVCESLFGPYRWERFDVLVLPPAFPFGGMENPRLTFATPTILAGDKSLVALIAHELAHSWSGNLVGNATWRDFWLNEGFTVHLEQRIMEALYGRERADMEILLGLQGLEEELAKLPPADQVLHIDLAGRNPDDGMTAVPYDKGAAFLRHLEQHFGRARFDAFLAKWFDAHAFAAVTTADFLRSLDAELLGGSRALREELRIDNWVFGTGLPAETPRPQSTAFAAVERERARWLGGAPASELVTDGWITHQWLHFLAGIPDGVGATRLDDLDRAFWFTRSKNSEILAAWLKLAIRHGHAAAGEPLESFLLRVGRRKFLKPLYEELAKTTQGVLRARTIYAKARPRYHAVAQRTLDAIVGQGG
jgi:aminopeptidase N